MLSIGIVTSSMDIHKYFIDKDNYYLTDKSEIKESSRFYGKGAEALGIKDKVVEEKLFLDLLEGRLPNGQQIGVSGKNHRPATDITLSAPKSFSVMSLIAGDDRLKDVQRKAEEKVYSKIESLYAEARKTVNGVTSYEKTGNLVIALFPHSSSREKDAQMHTHGVILNMTMRNDGQWRALSSRQKTDLINIEHGFRELIYQNQHYLGMIYNSELAKGAIDCGYELEVLDKYGNFKFKGLSDDYLKSQSKRREQILEMAKEKGTMTPKALSAFSKASRKIKEAVTPDKLKEAWQEDAKAQGVDLKKVLDQSIQRVNDKANQHTQSVSSSLHKISQNAKEAVNDAITHLSQFSVKLQHGDIVRQAFIFGGGVINHEELEHIIETKQKQRELIGLSDQYYTTKALITEEKAFKTAMKQTKSISWSKDIAQSGLIAESLKNTDRVQIINTKGLKNETNLINDAVRTVEANGLNAYVLHPNQSRLNLLKEDVTRDKKNIWQYFKNYFKHELLQTTGKFEHEYKAKLNSPFRSKKQDMIFVTDSQKLSYEGLSKLNDLAEKGNAKLILLNNTESTQGFRSGNPIKVLRSCGVAEYNSKTIKKEVLVEITQAVQTNKLLADYYTSIDKDKRNLIPIVASTNKAQTDLTHLIRNHLKDQGELSIQEYNYQTLSTKGLSDTEKKYLKCYSVGDQIMLKPFTKDQQAYLISGIDKENKTLSLISTKDNKAYQLSHADLLKTEFQINKKQTLSVSVNDRLMATRNLYIKANHLSNERVKIDRNSVIEVESIAKEGLRIKHNKQSLWLSNESLKSSMLDHGYVIKPHQLDKEFDQVITSLSGYQVNQNSIGELKEYAKNIHLFTDNKEKASKSLDAENIVWVATDIKDLEKNTSYNPAVRSNLSIEKDLQVMANTLSNLSRMTPVSSKAEQLTTPKDHTQTLSKEQDHHNHINDNAHSTKMVIKGRDTVHTAVSYGIAKLSEKEASFSMEDLLKESMTYALGYTTGDEIEKVIDEKRANGELLINDRHVTTKAIYELEKSIIDNITNGHNQVQSVVNELPSLREGLTQGQKDAISLALTTKDRFIGIQGLAGTGKTTMMKELREKAESNGYKIVGIAPTHKAVQMLDGSMNEKSSGERFRNAGIPVMTAHAFINQELDKYNDKTIFITDESSMIGNRLYHGIQEKTKSLNARTIFAGDIKQQAAIDQGKPQELSLNNGLKYASMNEIIRQRNSPILAWFKASIHIR